MLCGLLKVENLLEASAVCVSQLITNCACQEEPVFEVTLAVVACSLARLNSRLNAKRNCIYILWN